MRRLITLSCAVLGIALFLSGGLLAQPKYRSFSQLDFTQRKNKAGKLYGSVVTFTFRNDSAAVSVNSLHFHVNSEGITFTDSGGYTAITRKHEKKSFDLTGRTVAPGDSVSITMLVSKKSANTHINFWWWDTNGTRVGTVRSQMLPSSTTLLQVQPNGGLVLWYLYKRVVPRPGGLLVGLPNATSEGWIKYKDAEGKGFFPHTDSARCFDYIMDDGNKRLFNRRLSNPKVKKHNNQLLGEVHAMKLAILANDSSVTEPLDPSATAFGDLIYRDDLNPSDPMNNMTLRAIAHLADSALTHCTLFPASFYFQLDSAVSRVNRAFDGDFVAETFKPLLLAGTHTLAEVPFLHPNPAASPGVRHPQPAIDGIDAPEAFALNQNYPNPFNPTTTIDFVLSEPSIVSVTVYNIIGQKVATLVDRQEMEDGQQTVEFNASSLSSGVYYYRLEAQGTGENAAQYHAMKKMLLLK